MDFTPKSEDEIKRASLLEAGEYDFEILLANHATSKSGNEMIKIKLGIYSGDRITNHVFDYLLPAMEAKLRHFCDSVGLLSKYEQGTLCAEDCQGRSGRCKLVIKEQEGYPPKNDIRDYLCRPAKGIEMTKQQDNDSMPF